ncbi:MAG: WbqC family protein [Tenacibaculum sp.]|nr:WbqC family protein [Tenacibaculum sp.]
MALFIPTYFSPISQYSAIVNANEIIFETQDNFQKQTYRNRCYIYGANGKQSLNIPIKHKGSSSGRKKTKDVLIENDFPWQKQHFKSLQTAYQSSPFFEFFEDDLLVIFNKKYKFLHDLNIDTFLFVADILDLPTNFKQTSSYEIETKNDFRNLSIAKKGYTPEMATYTQMFDDKYGFLPNLSILDLLFMEGTNSLTFLEEIKINLP